MVKGCSPSLTLSSCATTVIDFGPVLPEAKVRLSETTVLPLTISFASEASLVYTGIVTVAVGAVFSVTVKVALVPDSVSEVTLGALTRMPALSSSMLSSCTSGGSSELYSVAVVEPLLTVSVVR